MRRSRNVGAALIGLLVVAAISVAAGSGRKPAKEPGATVSLRQLSGSEVMDILHRFPKMIPSDMAAQKNDTSYLVRMYGLVEVTVPLLARVFPAARFYLGRELDFKPSGSYLMAIAGDRRYVMPGGFNQLLLGNGLEVTDKNIIELAKAFVIVAVAERGPVSQVSFQAAKRTKQAIGGISYDAWLKVKTGDQMEEWYFDTKYGQFGVISRRNAGGLIKQYNPVEGKPREERGQLDVTPIVDIDSGAYVEWEGPTPHHYVVVEENGDSTGTQVRLALSDFDPNARNVYIRVEDVARESIRLFQRVQIDGSGRCLVAGPLQLNPRASAGWVRAMRTPQILSQLIGGKPGHFPYFFTS